MAESEPQVSLEFARCHLPSRGRGPFDAHKSCELIWEKLSRVGPVPCAVVLGKPWETFRTRQLRGLMINSGLGGWLTDVARIRLLGRIFRPFKTSCNIVKSY